MEYRSWKFCKNGSYRKKGFTLIELIVVLAIISIVALIAVSTIYVYIEKAKAEVCEDNCLRLERMYEYYLYSNGLEHSDRVFEMFLGEYGKGICPCSGEIWYLDGRVYCNRHSEGKDEEEEVPFL